MNKLVSVIGPAPSERTFPSLIELLKVERERVAKFFSFAKPKRKTKSSPRVKKPKTTLNMAQVKAIALATGVSVDDLLRGDR